MKKRNQYDCACVASTTSNWAEEIILGRTLARHTGSWLIRQTSKGTTTPRARRKLYRPAAAITAERLSFSRNRAETSGWEPRSWSHALREFAALIPRKVAAAALPPLEIPRARVPGGGLRCSPSVFPSDA